ncbi:MAG: hypothetical protein K2K22_00395, partial [Muribaculaceae bacterium]|nr:hypothetical protein [Muribaculaceae bacterium]
ATPNSTNNPDKKNIIIIVATAILALLAGWLVFSTVKANKRAAAASARLEQFELDRAQADLEREYQDLNDEFAQFENSRKYIKDDSIKRELNDKYEAARLQVEKLQQELASQKHKSAAEIAKLRSEIDTLRNLLRHYVEEIDRLNKENEALRSENKEIKERNTRLSNQVSETTRRNEALSERMTLAEKLNVTGLSLMPLNKKGKKEKKVAKAVQLAATFTIPQNNSTPVGEKTIYMRIVSPSGQLLGNGGTFAFEGGNVGYTAKKSIEYAGEEIGGITIYYDVNTPLIAGDYTVELFADNFRLTSRSFTLQ